MNGKKADGIRVSRRGVVKGGAAAAAVGAVAAAPHLGGNQHAQAQSAEDIANARGLTPQDMTAALKTYVPSGKLDEYYIFASGGHGGQVLVIGVPSMRLLKVIGVFTPEPWQGYGFDDGSKSVLANGGMNGKTLTWADTHHPGLSETNGEYDGQFLFINDKANSRLAVIDLRDFETKQIVKNPISIDDHGFCVTPDTEYVLEGAQYATPLGWKYAPIEDYQKSYGGTL
ncbi:MAG TPA: twin-arginine translocation signal domain-containing protein, partial [Thermomicrobiales bacterium]|nr:twin-arginine translocation signal domain-containing protein [Thermomicrobiales bacterium]